MARAGSKPVTFLDRPFLRAGVVFPLLGCYIVNLVFFLILGVLVGMFFLLLLRFGNFMLYELLFSDSYKIFGIL